MVTFYLVIAIVLEVGNLHCMSYNSSIRPSNEKKTARSYATKFRKRFLLLPNEGSPNHTIHDGKKNEYFSKERTKTYIDANKN